MPLPRRTALSLAATALLPRHPHAQTTGGTLIALVQPEPLSLISATSTLAPETIVSPKIFDGLFDYDMQFNRKPRLALALETSPDGLTLTLRLRPGVKWHDSTPFTSADIAYTALEVWKKINPRGRFIYANLTAIDTPDPLTAILRLSQPSPYIEQSLFSYESQVLPRHIYEGRDVLTNPANARPIGNGPFRFVEWRRGSSITLERNPDYWDAPRPYLDRIVFRIIPDAASRASALETGEVLLGAMSPVPLADIRRLAAIPELEIITTGYESSNFIQLLDFNLRHPILSRPEVRHAIAHAIDRRFIARNIWFGRARPATGPIPTTLPHWQAKDLPGYPFDPKQAEALLDAANLPRKDGVRFRITHDWAPYGDTYLQTAEYFKQAMKRIGIEVEIRSQDFATYMRRIYTDNDFDTFNYFLSVGHDPATGSIRNLSSSAIQKGAPLSNGAGYRSPAMDALLTAGAAEIDPAKRVAIYNQVQTLAMQDLPTLPLVEMDGITVANRRVMNHADTPDGPRGTWAAVWLRPA